MKKKGSWILPRLRPACLVAVTFVVVWNILFWKFPSRDDDTTLDSSQWRSANLKFKKDQLRGAAMMLVSKPWTDQRGERQCYFNASMDSLERHWYPTNPYPVILQHQDGWTKREMEDIQSRWSGLDIYFSKIADAFHVNPPDHMEDEEKPLSPLGYKLMCNFKTFGFLQAPYVRTNDMDYMFYIDDDACLTEPIQYDVFETMKKHDVAYAYKQIFLDRDYVVKGLSDFVEEYVRKQNLNYANPSLKAWLSENHVQKKAVGSHWAFSTNLEWIDLQQFRRPDVMHFHQTISDSMMIFHRRWGDAPLRFLLSFIFWGDTKVMKICSGYVHSMWRPSISSCTDEQQTPSIRDAVLSQLKQCTRSSHNSQCD